MALSKLRRDKLFDSVDLILLGAKIPREANRNTTRRRRTINPSAIVTETTILQTTDNSENQILSFKNTRIHCTKKCRMISNISDSYEKRLREITKRFVTYLKNCEKKVGGDITDRKTTIFKRFSKPFTTKSSQNTSKCRTKRHETIETFETTRQYKHLTASASAMGLRSLISRHWLHSSETAAGANTITTLAPQMLSLTSLMLIPEAFKPTIVLELLTLPLYTTEF